MSQRLAEFIEHARSKGMDYATIRILLLSAGWKDKEIARALAAAGLDLSPPVPSGLGSARNAFLYLTTFASLYAVVIVLIVLFFHYLDWVLPDVAFEIRSWNYYQSTIRWSLAMLLVTFPIFFFLTRVTLSEIRKESAETRNPVRVWLTYLTLFIATVVATCDLIALLYMFLEGELTARFVAKVIILFVIVGSVIWYYTLTLGRSQHHETVSARQYRIFGGATIVVALIAVGWGFYLAGSPFTVRLQRLDERRIDDLRSIQDAIQRMVTRREDDQRILKRPLPANLEEIQAYVRSEEYTRELSVRDPQTGVPYEYKVRNKTQYELSASFSLSRQRDRDMFWNHPAGRHTFVCDATKEE